MRYTFRLELDVVVDAATAATVIAAAREAHRKETPAAADEKLGRGLTASTEEVIAGIEDALMELVAHESVLSAANVEFERIACRPLEERVACDNPYECDLPSSAAAACIADDHEADDQLDEFETGLYLCRWPNGDFSVVKADTRKDAIVQLDEWAGAEPASLLPLEVFMVDFRLTLDLYRKRPGRRCSGETAEGRAGPVRIES